LATSHDKQQAQRKRAHTAVPLKLSVREIAERCLAVLFNKLCVSLA
jgi:hypothetical protein